VKVFKNGCLLFFVSAIAALCQMVYGNPRHKLREKKRKMSIDWELDEAESGRDRPDSALRFCLTCGKVRTYCEDFQTDESSGREDARSQGDTGDRIIATQSTSNTFLPVKNFALIECCGIHCDGQSKLEEACVHVP
jgi:hypothetical protein